MFVPFTKILKISILMGALFVFCTGNKCQTGKVKAVSKTNDTIVKLSSEQESSEDETDTLKVYSIHHTRAAIIASAIVPGLGQAYNRKYWKIPLIYGTGTLVYFAYDFENTRYKRLRNAYNSPEVQKKDPELAHLTSGDLQLNVMDARRYRDMAAIGIGIIYIANIVDAMVDSYMTEYDISKDLSMKVSPALLQPSPNSYFATCGVKMNFRF
jgi:hypothetical protein